MQALTRRFFLGRAAIALPAAAGITATATPQERAPLEGPITPDQYISEMHAIGWTCFAACFVKKDGQIRHDGVIEYCSDRWSFYASDDDIVRRRRLLRAVSESGPDFYRRAGDRLFELGLCTDVRADGPGPHPMPVGV